jgi:hypothetical protein
VGFTRRKKEYEGHEVGCKYSKQKEEHKMTNKFLVGTLVKYFGEIRTIKMLNLLQARTVNKKAKRYRARINAQQ